MQPLQLARHQADRRAKSVERRESAQPAITRSDKSKGCDKFKGVWQNNLGREPTPGVI